MVRPYGRRAPASAVARYDTCGKCRSELRQTRVPRPGMLRHVNPLLRGVDMFPSLRSGTAGRGARRPVRVRVIPFAAVVVFSLPLIAAPAGADPNRGKNGAAKLCQDGGYADYQTTDGTPFADEGACT